MGLDPRVGVSQADFAEDCEPGAYRRERQDLDQLAEDLAEHGVIWREPDPAVEVPAGSMMDCPYADMALLSRAVLLVRSDYPLVPSRSPDDLETAWNTYCTDGVDSHLLMHHWSSGYFVPVDFDVPVLLDERRWGSGHVVGSSQGLLRELYQVAPALGIHLDPSDGRDGGPGFRLSDAEAAFLEHSWTQDPAPQYFREQWAWLTLYLACRASITTGQAISYR